MLGTDLQKKGRIPGFIKTFPTFYHLTSNALNVAAFGSKRKWISLMSGLNLAQATMQFYISATNCHIQPTCTWKGQTSTADGFSSHCFHLLEPGTGRPSNLS